jgi:predicted glycosyltransferase
MDMTAAAHPLVLRPVVERLLAAGHDVHVTARDYGQTLGLLERLGISHTVLGPAHAGASRWEKGRALAARTRNALRFARSRRIDLAVAHGSNDLALAAAALRIPAVNATDYEWATTQHNIGCRLARRVLVPETIPVERMRRYGAAGKLFRYPGLKEEYYLSDFEPDSAVFDALGVDRSRVVVIVRPPPAVSMYHRPNDLFPRVLDLLGSREDVHAVVIPRVDAQREDIVARGLPSLIVPAQAVDAQSLIALADVVVSAGGTMNREAVALGTPVHTLFSGRLGGVDEALLAAGRLRALTDPQDLELVKRVDVAGSRVRRDPQVWVDAILAAAG